MTDEIRRVLQAWFDSPEGSEARQERIRARIAALEEQEEPVRKRSWPRVLALALASMLLIGTGLAAGLSLNVFNFFSDRTREDAFDWQKQKLNSLRDKNTLVSTSASDVPQGIDMDDIIQIHDAYYDGDVLFVGCVESRAWPMVEWTPTEEERAQFAVPSAIRTEDYKPINEAAEALIEQALEAGHPFGFKQYRHTAYFSRQLQTTGGVRLWYTYGTSSDYNASADDERDYHMTQFMAPLPEEIRGKDRIEVQLPVRIEPICYWFDGKELYIWDGEDERAMLTAVIDREPDVPHRQYEQGKITLEDAEVTVEADASPYLLHMVLRADEPIFSPSDPWHWRAYDDAGHALDKSFERSYGATPMRTDIHEYGSDGLSWDIWLGLFGDFPETLTLEIGHAFWDTLPTVTLRLAD